MRRIWNTLRNTIRRLGADESGVTAVEFGVLALPFFAIIGAIMQTSVIFLASQVLESAVNDAGRTIRTGRAQSASMTIEQFRTDVCNRLYGLFPDCAGLHIRVNVVNNFQSISVTPPLAMPCSAPCEWNAVESWVPGPGRAVVMVQVYYRYPVLVQLGPLGLANMADGRRLIGAATVFQNEPFSS